MGGQDQLIMYITGPAGAGKSTLVKIAQEFCFQFCRAVKSNWDNKTFLFTALRCAASLFGRITTHSAVFINKKSENITDADMSQWDNVQFLVVDEISMGTKKLLIKWTEA